MAGAHGAAEDRAGEQAPAYRSSAAITLYGAQWCNHCVRAKAFLDQHGLDYQVVDVDTPEGYAIWSRLKAKRVIPVLQVKGQAIAGFSEQTYRKQLNLSN